MLKKMKNVVLKKWHGFVNFRIYLTGDDLHSGRYGAIMSSLYDSVRYSDEDTIDWVPIMNTADESQVLYMVHMRADRYQNFVNQIHSKKVTLRYDKNLRSAVPVSLKSEEPA